MHDCRRVLRRHESRMAQHIDDGAARQFVALGQALKSTSGASWKPGLEKLSRQDAAGMLRPAWGNGRRTHSPRKKRLVQMRVLVVARMARPAWLSSRCSR